MSHTSPNDEQSVHALNPQAVSWVGGTHRLLVQHPDIAPHVPLPVQLALQAPPPFTAAHFIGAAHAAHIAPEAPQIAAVVPGLHMLWLSQQPLQSDG